MWFLDRALFSARRRRLLDGGDGVADCVLQANLPPQTPIHHGGGSDATARWRVRLDSAARRRVRLDSAANPKADCVLQANLAPPYPPKQPNQPHASPTHTRAIFFRKATFGSFGTTLNSQQGALVGWVRRLGRLQCLLSMGSAFEEPAIALIVRKRVRRNSKAAGPAGGGGGGWTVLGLWG